MSRQILNGWKEISNHIERGVRTAQRWEALLGMPVHRPALKDRSAVVAFTDELDCWITRNVLDTPDENGEGRNESLARLHDNMSSLAQPHRAVGGANQGTPGATPAIARDPPQLECVGITHPSSRGFEPQHGFDATVPAQEQLRAPVGVSINESSYL